MQVLVLLQLIVLGICSVVTFTNDQAFPPKPFPKLPAALFRDLRPRGALFHIAAACLRQQETHRLKKLDFASPANRKLVRT